MQDTPVEIRKKRTEYSQLFSLGKNRFRYEQAKRPIFYPDKGELVPVDLNSTEIVEGIFKVNSVPFDLRMNRNGQFILRGSSGSFYEVTLLGGDWGRYVKEGRFHTWIDALEETDYIICPSVKGCQTLLRVKTPKAPLTWQWQIEGDIDNIPLIAGKDAEGKILELVEKREGNVITVTATGRCTTRGRLRSKKFAGWDTDLIYPLLIDPVVNENVAASGDDVVSVRTPGATAPVALGAAYNSVTVGYYAGSFAFYGGVRFQTVAVPKNATINSATLTIRGISKSGTPNNTIYGSDVDDAAAFSNPGNLPGFITKTTASAGPIDNSFVTTGDNSYSVTGIIQELVTRSGWVSNNDIAFGIFPSLAGSNTIRFAAFDHATLTEPRLSIDYTAAAPSLLFSVQPAMRTLLRR